MNEEKNTLADLGAGVARLTTNQRGGSRQYLKIFYPDYCEDGAYTPAMCIQICGISSLRALQKLLNDNLPTEELETK